MFEWRETPWDRKALSLNTAEILKLENGGEELFKSFENENSYDMVYGRINVENIWARKFLLRAGFIPVEVSYVVELNKVDSFSGSKLFKKTLNLIQAEVGDFKQIFEVAGQMFNFSRFHESPFIETSAANRRMANWVTDLENTEEIECVVTRDSQNKVNGFMFFRRHQNGHTELVLGGMLPGFEVKAASFWNSVLLLLKELGTKKVTTTISAANSGVVSIYKFFDFKFKNTYLDFHKHY